MISGIRITDVFIAFASNIVLGYKINAKCETRIGFNARLSSNSCHAINTPMITRFSGFDIYIYIIRAEIASCNIYFQISQNQMGEGIWWSSASSKWPIMYAMQNILTTKQ